MIIEVVGVADCGEEIDREECSAFSIDHCQSTPDMIISTSRSQNLLKLQELIVDYHVSTLARTQAR